MKAVAMITPDPKNLANLRQVSVYVLVCNDTTSSSLEDGSGDEGRGSKDDGCQRAYQRGHLE